VEHAGRMNLRSPMMAVNVGTEAFRPPLMRGAMMDRIGGHKNDRMWYHNGWMSADSQEAFSTCLRGVP
jgi:hypothetical protein